MSCLAQVSVHVGGLDKQPGQTQSFTNSVTLLFIVHKMASVTDISLLCLASLTSCHQLPFLLHILLYLSWAGCHGNHLDDVM